jgi:hypothetical protein
MFGGAWDTEDFVWYPYLSPGDARQRAESRIEAILSDCEPREFDPHKKRELDAIMLRHAQKYGMSALPACG